MKLFWVSLVVASLGCAGCGQKDSAAQPSGRSAEGRSVSAVPDQPIRNPFPGAREVRLFVATGQDDKDEPIYSKRAGLALSPVQRAKLESLISVHTISPDEMFAMCFMPHHFFRYFDKAGKPVGEIAVCFCCTGVGQSGASNIRLTTSQMLSANFGELKSFVHSLGERTDVQCDSGPS